MSVKAVVERLMNQTNSKAHDEDLDEIVEIVDDDETNEDTTTQVTVAHSSWYPTYTIINNGSNFTSQKGRQYFGPICLLNEPIHNRTLVHWQVPR